MARRARRHFLEEALLTGWRDLDVPELLKRQIEHNSAEGAWETGVVSPSLTGLSCRLARLKKFLGHDPQPGLKHMAVRQGVPDPNSAINMIRGFNYEGLAVAALRHVLGEMVMGSAPALLFRARYGAAGWVGPSDDPMLSMWVQQVPGKGSYERGPGGGLVRAPELANGMVFAGHPDVLLQDPDRDWSLSLVQVKCPRISKCERIKRLGPGEALETYRAQMITEMYIGRAMGWPIERNYLLVGTMEGNFTGAKHGSDPYLDVIELEWHDSMRQVPEEVARQLVQDFDRMKTAGEWPEAYKESAWDAYPCSYCNYSRLGSFEIIGCTEGQEWERYDQAGETRLTAPLPGEDSGKVVRMRRRRTA